MMFSRGKRLKVLEDEPDAIPSQVREFDIAHIADTYPTHEDITGGRRIKASHQVQQR